MMVLWGTLVNALAIIFGGMLGLMLPGLSSGIRATVMQGIGLSVCILGVMMALKTENFLIMVSSLVIGGILGEWLQVDRGLQLLGMRLEKIVGSKGQGKTASGFVTTTLLYCVGAMAVIGSLDSGFRNNHDILYTKSLLDGFSAIIFASTLGIGVIFSSIPVLLYQGAITLASTYITSLVSPTMLEDIIKEITAVGGILIIAIGLDILEIKKVNIANLLPSIFIAAAAVPFLAWLSVLAG
jgi:uncharacterized membrane protein YqgA involved in biofilm formation